MKTELLPLTPQSAAKGAALIHAGEVVAFPTETVYGLGADALNEQAVKKIYSAKGRPSDNPLIVHVADKEQIPALVSHIPAGAQKLIDAFMPGPITVVMPKAPCIPDCVTGGIDTVGIRIPSSPAAREFLRACACPIAAPSANSSGKPSPTKALHVFDDLQGKIPLILDGGAADGGVESTVISLCGEHPLLLRPGLITYEMLCAVLGRVDIHPAVLENGKVDRAASPGMKYKHYAPAARVLAIDASFRQACRLYDLAVLCGKHPLLLWHKEALSELNGRHGAALLDHGNSAVAANRLFDALRTADQEGYDLLLVTVLDLKGAGLSVMNRLLRAAAFTVVNGAQIDALDENSLDKTEALFSFSQKN